MKHLDFELTVFFKNSSQDFSMYGVGDGRQGHALRLTIQQRLVPDHLQTTETNVESVIVKESNEPT